MQPLACRGRVFPIAVGIAQSQGNGAKVDHPVLAPPRQRNRFRALAEGVVAECAEFDEAAWAELEGLVEHALASRSATDARRLGLFLHLIDWLSLLRWGCPLQRLSPDRRTRLLTRLGRSPLLLLRRGVWGLRTLVFLGYYGRPSAGREVGYAADSRGWEANR